MAQHPNKKPIYRARAKDGTILAFPQDAELFAYPIYPNLSFVRIKFNRTVVIECEMFNDTLNGLRSAGANIMNM